MSRQEDVLVLVVNGVGGEGGSSVEYAMSHQGGGSAEGLISRSVEIEAT